MSYRVYIWNNNFPRHSGSGSDMFFVEDKWKNKYFHRFFSGKSITKVYNYLHRDLRYCLPSLKKNAWDPVYLEQSPEIWFVVLEDWEREKINYYYKLWKIETPVGILFFCHSKCFADQFVILKKKIFRKCKFFVNIIIINIENGLLFKLW